MLFSSLMLLLAAASLHVITNALMKGAKDKLAFVWWMLGIFCIACLPLVILISKVGIAGWIFVTASGLLEAIYFLTLSRAYTRGDLSVVYPIARGSAQLFILLWATLFLRERPSKWGLLGIFTILCGLYFINLHSLSDWKRPLQAFGTSASRWALLTGILISGYSAVDKVGIRYFSPLLYLYLIMLVCWIVLSFQWLIPERRPALIAEIESNRHINSRKIIMILVAATLGTVAYLLVLFAMRLSPVSYVGPIREVSVVLGAWIGIRFMSEQGGALRIASSILVACGIILIAVAG
jgi:drug/metabolite transporter (DMT)-like permease